MQRYSAQEQFRKATQTTKSMPDVVILQKLQVIGYTHIHYTHTMHITHTCTYTHPHTHTPTHTHTHTPTHTHTHTHIHTHTHQTAAEQEKKQSQLESEKLWGAPVQYGTTMVQVGTGKRHKGLAKACHIPPVIFHLSKGHRTRIMPLPILSPIPFGAEQCVY